MKLQTRVRPPSQVPTKEWDDLARAVGAVFAGPAWVGAADAVLDGGRVRVATAHDQDRLVGVLPVTATRIAGVDVVRFAGTGPSDYGTVLVDPDASSAHVVATLLDAVTEQLTGPVLLDLQQVGDVDPTGDAVRSWARAHGRPVRTLAQAETIRRTFGPQDGKDSKNRRTKDRKTMRLLGALGEAEHVTELLPDPEQVQDLVAELRDVDAAHPRADHRDQPWTGRTGEFLTEFLRAAPVDSRWLNGVRVDGRLVAYSLELVTGPVVGMYLCSYRSEIADTATGTMLLHDVRRRAHAHGAVVMDMLRGLETYKFRLSTSTHVSHRIVVAPAGFTPGRLLGRALTWRQDLRPWVKRARSALSRSARQGDSPRP